MMLCVIAFAAASLADLPQEKPSPTERRYECQEINDLAYGEDARQKLNLVLPKGTDRFPLLVWIGGGAWSYADRSKEMDLAKRIASRGIGVASVGHRLSPAIWKDPALKQGVRHPAHIEDVAKAFRWVRDQAGKYSYDPDRIFVGGYSSGGHLAALLSMDERRLASVGLAKSHIRGAIPIAGAYDISNYHQAFLNGDDKKMADLHVKAVFGDREQDFQDASPTDYVEKMSVPLLVISERNTYQYTKVFEEKLRAGEFKDITVIHIHKLNHGELWRNLSFDDQSECRDFIVNFIRARS